MLRMNKIDHSYFNVIDTEYKAYILGFLFADGCIVDNLNGRQKSLRCEIQLQDGYILEKLCMDICNRGYRIKMSPAQIKAGEQPKAVISINSDTLCEKLIEYGCAINKTKYGKTFPSLEKSMERHFIRGFFDGDGCLTVNKVKNRYIRKTTMNISNPFANKLRKRLYFVSTDVKFLDNILRVVQENVSLVGKPYRDCRTKIMDCHKLGFEAQKDIEQIANYLYTDATIYLKRKKDKFYMTISSQAGDKSSEGSETT